MTPVLHTGSGRIRGVHEEGVLAFRGIPYAQPPLGPLRFRPPHQWSPVWLVETQSNPRMQPRRKKPRG